MASRWGTLISFVSLCVLSLKVGGSKDNILALITNSTNGVNIEFSRLGDTAHSTSHFTTTYTFPNVYLSHECGTVLCKASLLWNDAKSDAVSGWYDVFVPVTAGVLILELQYSNRNISVEDHFLLNSSSSSRCHPIRTITTADNLIYTACILDGRALTFLQLYLDNLSTIHEAFMNGYNRNVGSILLADGLQMSNFVVVDRQELLDGLRRVIFSTGNKLNWFQFPYGVFGGTALLTCKVIERIEVFDDTLDETVLVYAYCGDTYTIRFDLVNEVVLDIYNNTYPVICSSDDHDFNNFQQQTVNISRINDGFVVESNYHQGIRIDKLKGQDILLHTVHCFQRQSNTFKLAYVDEKKGTFIAHLSSDHVRQIGYQGCVSITAGDTRDPSQSGIVHQSQVCPDFQVYCDRFVVLREPQSSSESAFNMIVYDTQHWSGKMDANIPVPNNGSIKKGDIVLIFDAKTNTTSPRKKLIDLKRVVIPPVSGCIFLLVTVGLGCFIVVIIYVYRRKFKRGIRHRELVNIETETKPPESETDSLCIIDEPIQETSPDQAVSNCNCLVYTNKP